MREFDPSCYYDDYLSLEDDSIVEYSLSGSHDSLFIKISNNLVMKYSYNTDKYSYFSIRKHENIWFFGDELNIYNFTTLGKFL